MGSRYPDPVIDIKLVRETPDVVRASQKARGEDPGIVDAILAADEARRSSLGEYERVRAEQKTFGKQVATAKGDEKAALVAQAKDLAMRVRSLEAEAGERERELDGLARRLGNVIVDGVPTGGEEDYVVREIVGAPRDFAAEGFEPRDHLALGELLGAIDMERGAKVSGSRFYFLTGVGARLELALLNLGIARAVEYGFTPMVTPDAGAPRDHGRRRVPRRPRRRGLPAGGRRPVPHRHLGGRARRVPRRRDPRPQRRPEAVCGVVHLLPARGRFARQGHPRHHPRAPVPEDRDVRLLHGRRRRGGARAAARLGARDARRHRRAVPSHRHGGRRPRRSGRAQVRLRGVDPDPGPVPRAHLDVQLHDVPGAAARRPGARRGGRRHPSGGDAERHPGDDAVAGRHPRDPPAAGRLGRGPRGAAAVPRARRPQSPRPEPCRTLRPRTARVSCRSPPANLR